MDSPGIEGWETFVEDAGRGGLAEIRWRVGRDSES